MRSFDGSLDHFVSADDICLPGGCILVELEERGLLLEVAHAVRVAVLEVGLHNVEDGRVVALQVLRYLADRDVVHLVLVDYVDALLVRDELLCQPLLLRLDEHLSCRVAFAVLLQSVDLFLKGGGDGWKSYHFLIFEVFGEECVDLGLFLEKGGGRGRACCHGLGRFS